MSKGRPTDTVWQSFDRVFEQGKLVKAKCHVCRELISAKVERLKKHAAKHSAAESGVAIVEIHSDDESTIAPTSTTTVSVMSCGVCSRFYMEYSS